MLASTVADLHQLGLVHGRIDPSHVLLGANQRPILCGFTGGGTQGDVPPPGPGSMSTYRDPAEPLDAPPSTAADVYALGALLRVLVVGDGVDVEPIPERRFVLRRGRPWTGYLRRTLLTLADQCTDDQPLRRPTARRLAADIESVLPTTRPSTAVDDVDDSADPYESLRPAQDTDPNRDVDRRLILLCTAIGIASRRVGRHVVARR